MKNLFKFFRGNGKDSKKITNEEILKEIKNLNTNICDRNYDLFEDISKLKDKYFKLDLENKETLNLIELREKDIKNLEKSNKILRQQLNDATGSVETVMNKLDSIMNTQDELLGLLKEFKGNVYEVKPIKKCIGSKQKMQIKPSAKNSSIIKKVVGIDEEEKEVN